MNHSGHNPTAAGTVAVLIAVGALVVATHSHAAQTGITRDAVELRAAPYSDANLVTSLPTQTKVEILRRRGGWIKINVEAYGQGWAPLHKVRLGDSAQRNRSSFWGLSMLWRSASTGRSGASGLVATTGIRGMRDEDITGAVPDPQAVKSLDGFQASNVEAQAHAMSAGLEQQRVEYVEPSKKKKKKKRKKKKKKKKKGKS
jgi:hypothetical protein